MKLIFSSSSALYEYIISRKTGVTVAGPQAPPCLVLFHTQGIGCSLIPSLGSAFPMRSSNVAYTSGSEYPTTPTIKSAAIEMVINTMQSVM